MSDIVEALNDTRWDIPGPIRTQALDEIASLRSTIATLQAELAELGRTHGVAMGVNADMMDDLKAELAEAKAALAKAEVEIDEMERDSIARDEASANILKSRNDALAAANARIANQSLELESLDSSVEGLRSQLQDANARIGELEAEIGIRRGGLYVARIDMPRDLTSDAIGKCVGLIEDWEGMQGSIAGLIAKLHPILTAVAHARAERAEAKVKELREALEPFANEYDEDDPFWWTRDDNSMLMWDGRASDLCRGDFRKARAALQSCDAPAKTVGEG